MLIPKKYFIDNAIEWSDSGVVKRREMFCHKDWYILYKVIFEYKGKFYKIYVNVPSTEVQEPCFIEDMDDEVECPEVKLNKINVYEWKEVE